MKRFIHLFLATSTICLCIWGQETASGVDEAPGPTMIPESYIALMRSDIQTKKTAILQQNLVLPDDQSRKFWPMQRSYESDLSKIEDQRIALIRDYTQSWDKMNDETAKRLGKRLLDFEKKRIDLRNKYFDQMSKQISPIVAAKFFQLETQMEDMIDISIASTLPLIK